ncbi:DUF4365 domain-containing protein [Candidatus Parabeggiatoa sp. HSG14]|uniref:DUF4365 domain-containing protein n=1 Tax=Candidatus Parabeggiatoa sp. HSG14 TaxID=3055593 RepID=UPI0025A72239|nr:DUF4365 domain-containing protein [Thiotrichales bacterium HSG14]
MHISQQQEQFSRAYVHTIASVAGFTIYIPQVDDDSVDLGIAQTGGRGTISSPRLEIQLKCTYYHKLETSLPNFSYPLKRKNYDDLRTPNVMIPRILVVIRVPEDIAYWLHHDSEQRQTLRYGGYWLSLQGMPQKNQKSIMVHLPRHQQFTIDSLQNIMQRLSQGGLP